ncbi:MAG: ATP-dependent zinc metalloprotease FtsH, partial [Ruthenibacterium sp.]
ERATTIARNMVMRYGFSERLGPVVYGTDQNETFLGRDLGAGRNYSENVASEIDDEIREMLDEAFVSARDILTKYMEQLHIVADALLEREKLSGEEFMALMQGKTLPPLDIEPASPKVETEKAEENAVMQADSVVSGGVFTQGELSAQEDKAAENQEKEPDEKKQQ